ncbi:MAG: RNA polymerase sigma factor [Pyrinomonadaceae bacterium]
MKKLGTLVLKATDSNATLAEQHQAFCELVRIFQDMAFACAYAVLGDFYLAEDAAQEAFISAWQKLDQLRQPEAFPGWFRRIVLTECNRLTRGKYLPTILLDDSVSVPSAFADPQMIIERDELTRAVFTAIKKLPVNQRVIVLLFYVEEYSQSDISAFLEVPLTTVAKRLYSARVRLRGMIMNGFTTDFAAHCPSRNQTFAERVQAGIYDEYVGQYKFDLRPDLVVTIRREGERLISEGGEQRNELFADDVSESELLTKEFDGRGKFVRDGRGSITHLVYYEFGCEMGLAQKIY